MTNPELTRRQLLRRLGITGAALAVPGTLLAACGDDSSGQTTAGAGQSDGGTSGAKLKVATFGGFFEENYKEIYPDFTAETGIEVESISEPGGGAWLVQLQQGVRAGAAPADVSMLSNIDILKALSGDLLLTYSESDVENAGFQADGYLRKTDSGDIYGMGAASWFLTLVTNTDRVAESPTSWKALWTPEFAGDLALPNTANTSFLLDITAVTWFDEGQAMLETEEGIDEVLAKLAELEGGVKLWWRDEATAQQDFNSGEVAIGEFYHDITAYAASQGEPLRSVFPEEGAIGDSGSWGITKTTTEPDAAIAFVDWFSQPEIQARLATTLGTTPTVKPETMELSAADYEAVAGPGLDAAIRPAYEAYQEREDWIDQRWSEEIFAS